MKAKKMMYVLLAMMLVFTLVVMGCNNGTTTLPGNNGCDYVNCDCIDCPGDPCPCKNGNGNGCDNIYCDCEDCPGGCDCTAIVDVDIIGIWEARRNIGFGDERFVIEFTLLGTFSLNSHGGQMPLLSGTFTVQGNTVTKSYTPLFGVPTTTTFTVTNDEFTIDVTDSPATFRRQVIGGCDNPNCDCVDCPGDCDCNGNGGTHLIVTGQVFNPNGTRYTGPDFVTQTQYEHDFSDIPGSITDGQLSKTMNAPDLEWMLVEIGGDMFVSPPFYGLFNDWTPISGITYNPTTAQVAGFYSIHITLRDNEFLHNRINLKTPTGGRGAYVYAEEAVTVTRNSITANLVPGWNIVIFEGGNFYAYAHDDTVGQAKIRWQLVYCDVCPPPRTNCECEDEGNGNGYLIVTGQVFNPDGTLYTGPDLVVTDAWQDFSDIPGSVTNGQLNKTMNAPDLEWLLWDIEDTFEGLFNDWNPIAGVTYNPANAQVAGFWEIDAHYAANNSPAGTLRMRTPTGGRSAYVYAEEAVTVTRNAITANLVPGWNIVIFEGGNFYAYAHDDPAGLARIRWVLEP